MLRVLVCDRRTEGARARVASRIAILNPTASFLSIPHDASCCCRCMHETSPCHAMPCLMCLAACMADKITSLASVSLARVAVDAARAPACLSSRRPSMTANASIKTQQEKDAG